MVELAQSLASIKLPDLSGKAVLITGASTGIGAALARAFAAQGAKVGMHYNASREPAEKLAEEIKAAGGTVHLIQGDVSQGRRDGARRRGDGEDLRPSRRPHQQCRRHARPQADLGIYRRAL